MNTCKNQKSYLYSFGEIDYEADDFEECNLSDELLSEDVTINKPTSILSLSENMENSPHTILNINMNKRNNISKLYLKNILNILNQSYSIIGVIWK